MTASGLVGLVKFCREESHADQFIKGHLYMNRLRYFQKLESSEKSDGRPDPREAIVSWHQPDRTELILTFPGVEPLKLGKKDLAAPFAVTRPFYSDMHLYCMTALTIPDPALLEGTHDEVEAQLQAAIRIDARCLDFGPHAVVVLADKFLPHLRRSLERCEHWWRPDMVEYYDESTFHGEFALKDAPFRKQSSFAYQKEYRVCLQTPTAGSDAVTFEIGDMSSFATKARSADIIASLSLKLKEPSSTVRAAESE